MSAPRSGTAVPTTPNAASAGATASHSRGDPPTPLRQTIVCCATAPPPAYRYRFARSQCRANQPQNGGR